MEINHQNENNSKINSENHANITDKSNSTIDGDASFHAKNVSCNIQCNQSRCTSTETTRSTSNAEINVISKSTKHHDNSMNIQNQLMTVNSDGTNSCDKLLNQASNFYAPILNGPIMTAQPPLYSSLLTAQQHTYPMPHPSPAGSSGFSNLSEVIRNTNQNPCFSNLNESIRANIGDVCSMDGNFKLQSVSETRQNPTNSNSHSIKNNLQENNRQGVMELTSRRFSLMQNEGHFNNFVYGTGNGDLSRTSSGHDQRTYDDYSRSAFWESQMATCGSGSSSRSTHNHNYPYPYADCRLDPSWNKCMPMNINNDNFTQEHVDIMQNKNSTNRPSVNNTNVNCSDTSKPFDCMSQSNASQVHPFIPYLSSLNYQQDIRSNSHRSDQNNSIVQQTMDSSSSNVKGMGQMNQNIPNLPSSQHHHSSSNTQHHQSSSTQHHQSSSSQINNHSTNQHNGHQNTSTRHHTSSRPQNLSTQISSNLGQNTDNHSNSSSHGTIHSQNISNHNNGNHTTIHHQPPNNHSHTSNNNGNVQNMSANTHNSNIHNTINHQALGTHSHTNQNHTTTTHVTINHQNVSHSTTSHNSAIHSHSSRQHSNSGQNSSSHIHAISGHSQNSTGTHTQSSNTFTNGNTNHHYNSNSYPQNLSNHQTNSNLNLNTIQSKTATTNHQLVQRSNHSTQVHHQNYDMRVHQSSHNQIGNQSVPLSNHSLFPENEPFIDVHSNNCSTQQIVSMLSSNNTNVNVTLQNNRLTSTSIINQEQINGTRSINDNANSNFHSDENLDSHNSSSVKSQRMNLEAQPLTSHNTATSHHSTTSHEIPNAHLDSIQSVSSVETIASSVQTDSMIRECGAPSLKKDPSVEQESMIPVSHNICLVCGCQVIPSASQDNVPINMNSNENFDSNHNNSNGQSMIDHLMTLGSKITVADKLSFLRGSPLPRESSYSQSICSKCFHLVNEIDLLEHRLSLCRKDLISKLENSLDRMGHRFHMDVKKPAQLGHSSQMICQQQMMTYQHHNHLHQQIHNITPHEDNIPYIPSQLLQTLQDHTTVNSSAINEQTYDSNNEVLQHRHLNSNIVQQSNLADNEIQNSVMALTIKAKSDSKNNEQSDKTSNNPTLKSGKHWNRKSEPTLNSCNPMTPQSVSSNAVENKMSVDCEIDIEECDNLVELSDSASRQLITQNCNAENGKDKNNGILQENDVSSSETNNYSNKENINENGMIHINEQNENNEKNHNCLSVAEDYENNIVNPHEISFLEMPSISQDRLLEDATEYHKPTLLGKNIKSKKHAKLQICRQCDRVFSNRQALVRHIERRHKSFAFPFSCDTCNKKFNSEKALSRHIQQHKPNIYTCKVCKEVLLSKDKLKKHLEEHSSKNLMCEYCEKECSSLPALISHMKTHTKEKKVYTCSTCQKAFANQRNLNVHKRLHTGETPFSCNNCDRKFSTKSNMVTHNKICTGKKEFACDQCNKTFPLKSLYKQHLEGHAGKFSHLCSVCGKGFGKASKLKAHMSTHISDRPNFTCQICGANLKSISGFTSHMSAHSGKMAVNCPICGKRLARKSSLVDHIAKHENNRSHQCPHCSKSFYYKSNLNHHIRSTHEQLKPFECSCCNKKFSSSHSYKHHLRTHTNEKPYQCESCGKAFTTKGNYSRHLRCHHQRTIAVYEEISPAVDILED